MRNKKTDFSKFSDRKILCGLWRNSMKTCRTRVYRDSSNNIWNISPFRLKLGSQLEAIRWHRFQFSDFKILCTLWRYSPLYLKAGTLRALTRIACIIEQHLKYKSVPPEI